MSFRARIPALLAVLLGVLGSAPAFGAGFQYPDLGSVGLGRAGAFAATADDPTAIAYNPAGLASLEGTQVLLEGYAAVNDLRFRRREAPYTRCTTDPATGQNDCADGQTRDTMPLGKNPDDGAVTNAAGWFPSGFLGVTHSVGLANGRRLGFGLAVHGPPALGRYAYPRPAYGTDASGRFESDPRLDAPQRYALIDSNLLIAYPGASLSYRHSDWLSFGFTLQYVYVSLKQTQAIFDGLPVLFDKPEHAGCNPEEANTCGPETMREEDPAYDSIATLDAQGRSIFTGVLGVLARPHPRVTLGASWRPGYTVRADGTFDVALSKAGQTLGAQVEGDEASVEFTMPHEVRVGVKVVPLAGLQVELDGTYEGWSSVDEMVITPRDMHIRLMESDRTLAPIVVKKGFVDAYSARLGAEYRLPWELPLGLAAQVRGGLFYETSAIPEQYTNIDFPHWERFGETVGFTLGTDRFEGTAAVAFMQQPDRTVTDSQVYGVGSDQTLRPFVVGNGEYSSSVIVTSVGVRGKF